MASEDMPDYLFRYVAEQLDTGILILDRDDTIIYRNRFMASHSRAGSGATVGQNLFDAFPELPMALLKRKLALVRKLGTPAFTSWRERPEPFALAHGRTFTGGDGRMKQNLSILPIADAAGEFRYACIAAYDVSEIAAQDTLLREANEQLKALSNTDLLTGLCNRREMERLLHHAEVESRRYGQTFSVLMIDVDFFKRVNDTQGHAAGDEALRFMGRLLTSQLRGPDTAARFGGEEFLVCLPLARVDEAMKTAERLRAAVESAWVASPPHSFQITVSIGVAEWSDRLEGYLALIDQADKALYRAKEDGRNRCVRADGVA